MSGYFLVFFYAIYVLIVWFKDKTRLKIFITKKAMLSYFALFIMLLPVVIPYYVAANKFNAYFDIRDAIHFALQPEDLLFPNNHTRLEPVLLYLFRPLHYSPVGEVKVGYIGLVFSILSIVLLLYVVKNRKGLKSIFLAFFLSGVFGFLVSLGPALHLGRATIHVPFPIPLPYAILYYIAPGFGGFRNSARFEMMFILFFAVAIGFMLAHLFKKYRLSAKIFIYSVLIFGIIMEYKFPMEFYPVTQIKNFPPVYKWLTTTPENSKVIFLPIYNWNNKGVTKEIWREYYSSLAMRKMVNGASGISPMPWQEFVIKLQKNFPKNGVQELKDMGVNYIIVSTSDFDSDYKENLGNLAGDYVVSELLKNRLLKETAVLDTYHIFEFK
jgi:hypothetical protein